MTGTCRLRGRLTVFLGYAAGVGKTYQMLVDASRLKAKGVDVVIGYFEPHARPDTIALTAGLEQVARRPLEYRGVRFEEMDAEAIARRRPAVALVDELAHTNVPGSRRAKRWEDVLDLQDEGIDVFSTMNVQHIESLNDQILRSTGVRVRETVPDWMLNNADEVVLVDVTPRALLNRLARGVVYPADRVRAALSNFFREPTLVALRELAMRQAAHVVEARNAGRAVPGQGTAGGAASERLLLLVGPDPSSAALIRRGRRVADHLGAECVAVFAAPDPDLGHLTPGERERLERHFDFARGLRIETRVLIGRRVADTVVAFAREQGITHILMGRDDGRRTWRWWPRRSWVEAVVSRASGLQVTVVAGARG